MSKQFDTAALTSRQREAFALRRQGKTHRQIAEVMEVSSDRVRQLLSGARYRIARPARWTDGLDTRSVNAIAICGIEDLSDLRKVIDKGVLQESGICGAVTLGRIRAWLKEQG